MRIRLLHGYPPHVFDQQECDNFELGRAMGLRKRRGNVLVDERDDVGWPRGFAR